MKATKPFILMLEDDEDDRHITKTFFAANSYNFTLKFLAQAEEVLPYLELCVREGRQLPNLVILDKNVPAGGGMDVLRDIKTHDTFRVLPVVMISGSTYPEDITEAYRLGVNSYIAKPFSSEHTAKTIQNFLNYWLATVEFPGIPVNSMSVI